MKRECKNCRYYHKADAEHGSDGCYFWCYGSRYGFDCYKTEDVFRWIPTIISATALIISIIVLVIRLAI